MVTGVPNYIATYTAPATTTTFTDSLSCTASNATGNWQVKVPIALVSPVRTSVAPPSLLITDSSNDRVLLFDAPLSPGVSATAVLGQASFGDRTPETTASGFAGAAAAVTDQQGNIWVTDGLGNRVLRFSPLFVDGMAANLVIGQPNFTASDASTSLSGLSTPHGLVFDKSGNLWIADSDNGRILEFSPPFTSGMAAILALGQPPFSRGVCLFNSTASNLCYPTDLRFDTTGNLWVVDSNNNRIVEFQPPFVTGQSASIVLGEPDFSSRAQQSPTSSTLYIPWGAAFDKSGNLWVTDGGNWRVLEFSFPFSNGQSASVVLGFPDFTGTVNNRAQSDMSNPRGVTFDAAGNLLVADLGGSRVLVFKPPFTNGMDATSVIGQPNLTTLGGIFPPTAASLSNPLSVFVP